MTSDTKKISAIIVDDESLARKYLRLLLEDYPDIEIVAECADGIQALDAIQQHHPQLLFLDIQMPRMDGFGVVEKLSEQDSYPAIIFVTAYDKFALKAIQAHAVEYIVKPFDAVRLRQAIDYGRSVIESDQLIKALEQELRNLAEELKSCSSGQKAALVEGFFDTVISGKSARKEQKSLQRIVIKDQGKRTLLSVSEIIYIKSVAPYVEIMTPNGKVLLRQQMAWLETRLSGSHFIRIHRSYIVRVAHIKELRTTASGDYNILLDTGSILPVSRRNKEQIRKLIESPE